MNPIVFRFMFRTFFIIFREAFRLFTIKSQTFSMISGVQTETGLPACSSSSSDYLPPKIRLYHTKTFNRLKHSLPSSCCISRNVSYTFLPSFAWNLITDLCSILKFQHRLRKRLRINVIYLSFVNRFE